MVSPLFINRILGDRPFAEAGDPVLAVSQERRGLLAVAGSYQPLTGHHEPCVAPIGVYDVNDLSCRAVCRSAYPVHALAFHPTLPLLAAGTGRYDGGHFFEGALYLMNLETGAVASLFEHPLGRQVVALQWLSDQELRLLVAPHDDCQDKAAWSEGHVAVIRRRDWLAVPPGSIGDQDLVGPRVAAPRVDEREEARRAVSDLSSDGDPRRDVRALERLSDGTIVAALDGVQAECWLPSGERQWSVPDDCGGRDLVVAADEGSVWVALIRPPWEHRPQLMVRLSVPDGTQLEHLTPSARSSLMRSADGLPVVAPMGEVRARRRLRIRRGSRIYYWELPPWRDRRNGKSETWLAAAALPDSPISGRPHAPAEQEFRRLLSLLLGTR